MAHRAVINSGLELYSQTAFKRDNFLRSLSRALEATTWVYIKVINLLSDSTTLFACMSMSSFLWSISCLFCSDGTMIGRLQALAHPYSVIGGRYPFRPVGKRDRREVYPSPAKTRMYLSSSFVCVWFERILSWNGKILWELAIFSQITDTATWSHSRADFQSRSAYFFSQLSSTFFFFGLLNSSHS